MPSGRLPPSSQAVCFGMVAVFRMFAMCVFMSGMGWYVWYVCRLSVNINEPLKQPVLGWCQS